MVVKKPRVNTKPHVESKKGVSAVIRLIRARDIGIFPRLPDCNRSC